ncbi:MAG TPA: hypothetical protein VFW38_01030 [Solirubrobacteraceae bacterium]|nr:hypothetical protein [Solirubrobacteraceae bacterium]
MILVDRSKQLSEPPRWTRAGAVAVALVVLALAAGTVVAVIVSGGAKPLPRGCVEVTFASTLGAASERLCGAHAREACAAPAQNPALAAHGALRAACRKAGLPYAAGAAPKPPIGA